MFAGMYDRTELDDSALLAACRTGDERAWDVLVTRYERLVYSVARRSGLDTEQINDVFQRVFGILIERLDTINQPSALGAWLIRTTQREAWRVLRSERINEHILTTTDEASQISDTTPSPTELVMQFEEQQRVRAAINQLDPRCRELITMLFFTTEPLSYLAIANQLGISEGSIGPTRARCLEKLRRLLTNDMAA